MVNKVRVYGKAQNRTALGIVNAYLVMYPHATLNDLKKAFPNSLNTDCGTSEIFMAKTEIDQHIKAGDQWYVDGQAYFTGSDEWLKLSDNTQIAVVRMWTKGSFQKMVDHAAQYGIEIAEFTAATKGFGQKGGYHLEYLNGYVPPAPATTKNKKWLWILIAIIVILAIIAALLVKSCNKEPAVVEKVVEKEVVVHDTVYMQQIEEIEKNFNAAEFEKGKSVLPENAKFVLHDLAQVMTKNPQIKLRLEGHTSAEGDAAVNQKLSEDRAQAAVDFLIQNEGIDASRLEAAGFGSTRLKNTDNPNAPENRRTEFIVVE